MGAEYPLTTITDIHYPEGDGQPVAETEIHRDNLFNLLFMLRHFFENDANVVVSGNLLIYYVEGNPRAVVAPDLFVVFGIPRRPRRVYKVWEEGKGPDVVIELTSASTRWEDLGSKKGLYEALGVKEYFLFDPFGEYLNPPLQGFQWTEEGYRPIRPLSSGPLTLRSELLGLDLRAEGEWLRLIDPSSGRKLPTPDEVWAAWKGEG